MLTDRSFSFLKKIEQKFLPQASWRSEPMTGVMALAFILFGISECPRHQQAACRRLAASYFEILRNLRDQSFLKFVNPLVVRNYLITLISVMGMSLGLAEMYNHPARISRQQRLGKCSIFIRAGLVAKTKNVFRAPK